MDFLIIGASGLIGSNVATVATERGADVVGTYSTNQPDLDIEWRELDIQEASDVTTLIDELEPTTVVNCAAVTDIGTCQQHPELARSVNAEAAGMLAEICAEHGIDMVHYSTEFIFDGYADEPYADEAQAAPIQEYGTTKLAGDEAVMDAHPHTLICRPSFVWGVNQCTGELLGFPARVRDRLADEKHLSLSSSRSVTPSRAETVARRTLDLVADEATGTYNVASRSCVTPFMFGSKICTLMDADSEHLHKNPHEQSQFPAPKPLYTCLDVNKVEQRLGSEQPTLDEELAAIELF